MLRGNLVRQGLISAILPVCGAVRTFVVYNNCPFTVWPALYTDVSAGTAKPDFPTGWQANAFTSVTFSVPDNWTSGRIWGRRECDFSTQNTSTSCLSGGCNGGLLCDPSTGTGVPPATLAEWTLSGDGSRDFYDVSVVDGYNIPMRIENNVNCPVADCPVDLGPNCPAPLKGPVDPSGYALGCKSACEVDTNPTNSPNCCSGSFNTAATCPVSNVQYYSYFKGNCPNAYAYAYDESSNTALWTCSSQLQASYTLTFCPSGPPTSSASIASASSNIGTSAVPSAPSGTQMGSSGVSTAASSLNPATSSFSGSAISATPNATSISLASTYSIIPVVPGNAQSTRLGLGWAAFWSAAAAILFWITVCS